MRLPLIKTVAAVLAVSGSVFSWTSGPITVDVVNSPMNIKVSAGGKTLTEITGITFGGTNYTSLSSNTTDPNNVLILSLSGGPKVTVSGAGGTGIRFAGRAKGVSSIKLTMKDAGDHFFGITEKSAYFAYYGSPDLRGRTIDCVVWSQPNNEHQGTHNAYSAFYYSSHGYGGFFDTYAMGKYSFAVSGQTIITHDTDSLDWYMFYGPTGDKVHQAYFKIIGAPKSVPMWACGPEIWRDNPGSAANVVSDVTESGKMQLPLASYLLDRPFGTGPSGWGDMNFSNEFANPDTWIKKTLMEENNVNVIAWHAPLTWGAPYPPGTFTTGYYYLDLSNPTCVSWYIDKLTKNFANHGVRGSKQDRVDENFPTGSAWHDGTPQPERQAKVIYLNAKITDSIYKTAHGADQFTNSRAAYHRCQPYLSAVWGGDTPGDWDGLACSVDNTVRVGFMGFPMFGTDISGYLFSMSSIPDELHIRWVEFGTFSAYMEHHISGKLPWTLSAKFKTNCKFYYDLRMTLLPYVYSIVNTSVDNGVSMPGLQMVYPNDAKTYAIWDEYMLGPAMLVAPVVKNGATSRSVYLPEGTWINFWDYADVQAGGNTITANAPLERIPVYIKANSLYPTGLVFPGNMKKWMPDFDSKRSITINAFPGAAGQSATFTYVDFLDNNQKKDMTVEARANNVVVVKSPALTVPGAVAVCLAAAPTKVYLNGAPVSNPSYDAAAKKLTVPFAAGQQITLSINDMVGVAANGLPAFSYNGKITAEPANRGVMLSIPAVDNAKPGTRMRVTVLNMQGRCVWKSEIAANPYAPSPVHVDCARGAYLATVKCGALTLGCRLIVVP